MTKEEYKEWYESCEFIDKEMQFYSYQDFIDNSSDIKFWFKHINYKTKKLYMWYIFSGILRYNEKCMIWDYLNDIKSYDDLIYNHLEHRTINQF